MKSWNGTLVTHHPLSIENALGKPPEGGVPRARLTSRCRGCQRIVLNIQGRRNVHPIVTRQRNCQAKPKRQPYSTSALSYRVSGEETSVRNCQVLAKHFPLSHGLLALLETSCRRCQAVPRLSLSSLNPQAIRFRHAGSFHISQSDTFAPKRFCELKFKHKPRVWISRMRLLFGLRPNQRDVFLAMLQFIYTLFPWRNLNLNTNKQNCYSVFGFFFSFLPFRVFTALAAVLR